MEEADESGIDTYLYREYGYAPRGQQVFGRIRGRKYQRCGIVAAQMGSKILAPFQYGGTMDSRLFEFWFSNQLLPSLESSITVNQLTIHNRLVMLPLATSKCDKEGVVSSALCNYYNDKPQGGHVGLIITEHCFVSREGKAGAGQLSIADDGKIEGLRQLVDTIHGNGTAVFAQISHAGTAASPAVTGLEAIGPSVILPANRPAPAVLPREMTADDMETIKDAFVKATLRAKAADCVK